MGFHDGVVPGAPAAEVRVDGPLAPFAGVFREALAGQGYSPRSSGELLRLVSALSRWMAGRGLAAGDVTAEVAEDFARQRRADGCERWVTSRSLWPMLACLQVTRPDAVGGVPVTGLLARYRDWLVAERGTTSRCCSTPSLKAHS